MLHRKVEEHDRERELDRAPHNEKTGMLLEKSENLLELSVKQLAIQSRLVSSITLGQAMFCVRKTKCKCCL